MLYKVDWELTQKRFIEYWEKENHDRPLVTVYAPRDGHTPRQVKSPESLIDRWMNIDYLIESSREGFARTFYGGEAFPIFNPNLGPDILGAILGCNLNFGEATSWAEHMVDDWNKLSKLGFDPENKWWKKIVQITEAAVKDANGDYFVGITDLHPGADALVSLRGPENLCTDLYDNSEEVKKRVFEVLDVFRTTMDQLYAVTTKNLPGTTNWMGVWHPDKWYVTSCDFICMISREMFSEFILPELQEEIEWLDASIFHLDGPGALKHLDTLLSIPKLKGIQWVSGAGQPSASHWIPVLKKIQDAGKLIHVDVRPDEIDILLQELRPEGVLFNMWVPSEQDARDVIKKVENSYKKKLY